MTGHRVRQCVAPELGMGFGWAFVNSLDAFTKPDLMKQIVRFGCVAVKREEGAPMSAHHPSQTFKLRHCCRFRSV